MDTAGFVVGLPLVENPLSHPPGTMDKREDVLHRGTVISWYGTGLAVVALMKSARTGPCSFLVG
jgi:hypothetical protein